MENSISYVKNIPKKCFKNNFHSKKRMNSNIVAKSSYKCNITKGYEKEECALFIIVIQFSFETCL